MCEDRLAGIVLEVVAVLLFSTFKKETCNVLLIRIYIYPWLKVVGSVP